MNAFPRVLAALAIIATTVTTPLATAGDCVEIYNGFSESIQFIASAGSKISLGFALPAPADGTKLVAVIQPSACPGSFGAGGPPSGDSVSDLVSEAQATLDDAVTYLGLP